MLKSVVGYFLTAYEARGYVLRQKAWMLLWVCGIILAITPVIIIMNLMTGQVDVGILLPMVMIIVSVVAAVTFLKKGYFAAAAHIILSIALLAVLATLFLDTSNDALIVLDSVVYIPAILSLIPLIVVRKRSAAIVYVFVALAAFCIFVFTAASRFTMSPDARIDYLVDTGLSILIVGLVSYQVLKINRTALDISESELKKNLEQYRAMMELNESIGEISGKLSGNSAELSSEADAFSTESQSQAATVEEITATTESIAGGMELVTERVNRQYSGMGTLTRRIDELSSTVQSIAETMDRTIRLADGVSETASRGGEVLSAMNESLSSVNESSGKMTGIVGLIGDISDRTNLLSLNAAIEAARAGEAGRGFAVVADEISKLADQTASSIKEIDRLIKANVEEIGRGMTTVEETVETIMRIIEGVSSIGAEVAGISSQMDNQREINRQVTSEAGQVMGLAEEIRDAMEEQKSSMDEIVKSISTVNRITQSYAQGADRLFRNSKEVQQMAESLHVLAKNTDGEDAT